MAPSSSKLLFLALFLVNCLLWSNSRYGQIPASSSHSSLVKRFASEWNELSQDPSEGQCRPVAYSLDQQCAHVTENENCPQSDTFLSIQYLQNYFCTELPLRPASFVGLIIWLIFLFSTLGISASDFFTPNLATIAQLLGLDENVAGVTFLAFGNGSPDVFSTFSAMRANSGSLAIGELLGAATFIVSCVVGSICIIKPFKVNPRPFLRDVGFFSVAVSMLLVILWDGHIRPWEAAAMVVLYLIYVVVVVVQTWWDRRREDLRMREAMARAEYQDEDLPPSFDEPYRDDPSPNTLAPPSPNPTRARTISTPNPPRLYTDVPRRPYSRSPSPTPRASPQFSHMPSFSLVGALEFRQVVASLRQDASSSSLHMFDSPITPYAGGHYHSSSRSSRSLPRSPRERERNPFDESLGLPMNDRSPQIRVSHALPDEFGSPDAEHDNRYLDEEHPISMSSSIPTIHHTPASPTGSESDSETNTYLNQAPPSKRWQALRAVYHTLFPSLHSFKNQSILGQIAAIFAAPAVLMLTLTLPVVVIPYECAHHLGREKILSGDSSNQSLVGFEEEGVERVLIAEEEVQEEMHGVTFNKWLTTAQCIFGPMFCVTVLFSGTSRQPWLFLAAGVAGFSAAVLVAVFAKRGDNPAFTMARCSMGFIVAVVWIMAIADEVVRVLQTFGFIFGLSDAIIGLTIFAVGNSLADLVANMSIAVFAPIMGFSACFGGPMLNILLGVGISGSYITSKTSEPYALNFGKTLFVSTIGLMTLLAVTLIYVPINGYHLTRRDHDHKCGRRAEIRKLRVAIIFYRARYGLIHTVFTKPDLPAGYYHAGNYVTQCSTVKDEYNALLRNCEDATFWEMHDSTGKLVERKVLVSCDAGRREWNTVMGPLEDPEPHGSLWLVSPTSSEPTRIILENYPDGHDFHPLGVEVYPSYGGNASYLYAVNHARERTYIEQFLLDPAKPTQAKYLQTISSPWFISPNSIALTSPTSFFVTNDHLFTRRLPVVGHFIPLTETLLGLPLSFVSYVSFDEKAESATSNLTHSVVAPFISFSNGVALSPSGSQVAIASTVIGQVYIYNIIYTPPSPAPSLAHVSTIQLPISVDNLAWTTPEEIIVGGHPHFPSLLGFIAMKEKQAPSWVVSIKVDPKANGTESFDVRAPLSLSSKVPPPPAPYTLETLFQSDGTVFSTSTTGLRDPLTGNLYVSGLYADDGLLICKPETN
ncbi:hypothetical protein VNI00_005127 [Paramarasmius palmivorus]|uniref:Sodium/calcium exchanger membrane region domain-containing protein n=1 Tax=Paramarasmius palmivorus TaxID=297713 RepID=A0AAW0DH63_9AGAR